MKNVTSALSHLGPSKTKNNVLGSRFKKNHHRLVTVKYILKASKNKNIKTQKGGV